MGIFTEQIQSDSYIPLRLQVYKALKDAIVGGQLPPGERIIEDRVCGELGVSRSPLREALRQLEGEGLVSILPRRGAVVTEIFPHDCSDLFAVREALEGLAAGQAASHITDEELAELDSICQAMLRKIRIGDMAAVTKLNSDFHNAVVKASRNRWIKEFLSSVRFQIKRFYRSSIEVSSRAAESVAEHQEMLVALRTRDPQAAERAARDHIQRARDAVLATGIDDRLD